MLPKLRYFFTCASKLSSPTAFYCPSCRSSKSTVVSRKYLVTSLRRCDDCLLLFRTPTTTAEENARFYQETYRQGFTSDTPTDHELPGLLQTAFKNSEKDYSVYLNVLQALGAKPGARVLDFGCSWGYGSWQLQAAGYEVTSFEISKPRCQYAREKLNINAFESLDAIRGQKYDIFFSAHVLEHVPSVAQTLSLAREHLVKGGLFVAFTPNGSDAFRAKSPAIWQRLWNHVHPNFLDARFYRKVEPKVLLASNPYDASQLAKRWTGVSSVEPALDGVELLAAWRV